MNCLICKTETRNKKYCSHRCYTTSKIGIALTKEHKKKISISQIAEKNPLWKGVNVGYSSLHESVRNRKIKPSRCQRCKKLNNKLDLANQ